MESVFFVLFVQKKSKKSIFGVFLNFDLTKISLNSRFLHVFVDFKNENGRNPYISYVFPFNVRHHRQWAPTHVQW